ncbi:MAG: hypothetical protein ACPGD5_11370, partial [Salibacteraceae bacterium]
MRIKYLLALVLSCFVIGTYAQLSGSYTIGSGTSDDYTCLTCSTGVFKAIADSGVSGNLTLNVTTDLSSETGDFKLSSWAAPNTIELKASNSNLKTITYTGAGGLLIDLDSISNFSIDGSVGGSGRYLRFVSAQTANAVLQVNNDCKNVTIKNSEFRSNNTSTSPFNSGAINLRSYGNTGNDNVTIQNNLFENNGSALSIAICVNPPANSGQLLENLLIKDNEINNVQYRGI